MQTWHWLLVGYLVILNITAFFLFGADKRKARKQKWRIPEKTLFLAAILGGSIGAILGMRVFHHKTRHPSFRFGIPAILIVQLVAAWMCISFLTTGRLFNPFGA